MNRINPLDQLLFNALPKISPAFVTHRAPTGGTMTVCLENEDKEATVNWKKLNIIIRRGTLFLCQYEKVVENGEHKFIVTKAIELNKKQPIYKPHNAWKSVRLFKFQCHTGTVVNGTCVETGYQARLTVDTNGLKNSAFNFGDLLVGWSCFETRNNGMGPSWYLVEVEGTLAVWEKKQKNTETEHKLTPLDLVAGSF